MTYIARKNIDDLLREVFKKLLASKSRVSATKGENGEIFGVLLELKDPRARLSRAESRSTIYSCLGEFLWYMSKTDRVDFVEGYISRYGRYAEADGTVNGAYGPRLFGKAGVNQIQFVIDKLREKPDSRKAVIQLYDARDTLKDYKDVPCTCTLQFAIRNGLLVMQTHMRSNDAFMGLPHDIFCFTLLQEMMARTLNVKLGRYLHSVGSLHLYDRNIAQAEAFLEEAYQDEISMPRMPNENPWDEVNKLLNHEAQIREDKVVDLNFPDLTPYWADIARLVAINFSKSSKDVVHIKNKMKSNIYQTYVRKKFDNLKKNEEPNLDLFDWN